MEKRLTYIDWAKAIGIMIICIGHFLPNGYWMKVLFYSFHVPMFAFVSGMLVKFPARFSDCLRRIQKLLCRLMIPYTIWFAITAVVYDFWGLKSWTDVIRTYFFLDGTAVWNNALWYAPSFFIAAVVFYVVCWAIRGNIYAALGISACSLGTFVFLEKSEIVVSAFGFQDFHGIKNILLLFGFLALGFACRLAIRYLAERKENPYKNSALYVGGFLFVIGAVLAERLNRGNNFSLLKGDYNDPVLFVIFATILTLSFVLSCALLPSCRVAQLLSANSLFLMCSHYIFRLKWIEEPKISGTIEAAPIRLSFAVNALLIYVLLCMLLQVICRRFPVCSKFLKIFGMSF